MKDSMQTPFEVAIIMAAVVRPSLTQAIRSIYAQRFGGALKTILSYAANSRYVTYLDDDNWYAPEHLATMLKAVEGKAWAFALRHFVEGDSGDLLCPGTRESMGPGRGVYAQAHGGFVDTNCYCIDTQQCADVFPEWAMTRFAGGTGGDRQILQRLRNRPWGTNGAHTVHYRQRLAALHPYLLWRFHRAVVDLSRYLPAEAVPGEAAWPGPMPVVAAFPPVSAGPTTRQIGKMGDQRGQQPRGDPWPALADQCAAQCEQQEHAGKDAARDLAQTNAAAGLSPVDRDEHRFQKYEEENQVDHATRGKQRHHGRRSAPTATCMCTCRARIKAARPSPAQRRAPGGVRP
jgi:hypothetical protein